MRTLWRRPLARLAALLALAAAVSGGFERRVLFELTPAGYVGSVEMFAAGTRDVEIDPRKPSPEIPYVLPGPADQWAGGMSHALRFRLGRPRMPRLVLHLHAVETHDAVPPLLAVDVNGRTVGRIQTRQGTGLAPPHEGRGVRSHYKVKIPAVTRERGEGLLLSITNESGSWVMWERIRLVEADRTFAWANLKLTAPPPPMSAAFVGASLLVSALLWSGSRGTRARSLVAIGGSALVLVLLGLAYGLPIEASLLTSLPRWVWLTLPWVFLVYAAGIAASVARAVARLSAIPGASAREPLSVKRTLLTIPVWLAVAFLLQGNILWEFERAQWGADLDGTANLWGLAWQYHALTTDPSGLFDANIYYPARDTLALLDQAIANQLLFAPAYALTGSPIIGGNVLMTGQFVVAALATMILAHRLFGSWRGAVLAGAMFAFSPTRLAHLGQPNLFVSFWTPLALHFLDRFLEFRTWGNALGFSLCLALQFLSGGYLGYFLLVAVLVWVAGSAIARPRALIRRDLVGKGLAGLAMAAVLVVPFSLPYLRVRAEYETLSQESPDFLRQASAEGLVSYFAIRPDSILYGQILSPPQSGLAWEKWLFPGFLCLGLAVLAFVGSLRRGEDSRERVWLVWALVGTAFVLSLGPEIRLGGWTFPSPHLLLRYSVPGFSGMRVSARFGMLAAFGLSLAAAAGYRRLEVRLPRRPFVRSIVLCLALAVVVMEAAIPARASTLPTPSQVPGEYRWLAKHGTGALLELPFEGSGDWMTDIGRQARYMYLSTYHWRPMVLGYARYPAGITGDVLERVRALPSHESMRYLRAIGVRQILIHPDAWLDRRFLRVADFPDVSTTRFPNGSLVVTLPESPRGGDVTVRLLIPPRLKAGVEHHFGVMFVNSGSLYWVNPTQRSCHVATTWTGPGHSLLASGSGRVLPPVALAPGEMRERSVEVRVPPGSGTARLVAVVTCSREAAGPRQWTQEAEVTLVERMNTGEEETEGLQARYLGYYVPSESCAGCSLPVRLHVKNTSSLLWKTEGLVRLGYYWTGTDGDARFGASLLEGRLLLERDVYPGGEVVIRGTIPAPQSPGVYRLTLELLREGVAWFREFGATPVRVRVTIE